MTRLSPDLLKYSGCATQHDYFPKFYLNLFGHLANAANEILRAANEARSQKGRPADIVTILSQAAREPTCGVAFNSASLILNSSFFLEKLVSRHSISFVSASQAHIVRCDIKTKTGKPQEVPEQYLPLMDRLSDSLAGRSRGMSGSGFLWVS